MTAATARAPLDLRTAEGMLSFVPDCEDRETWLAMGMALKSEYGAAAFDGWAEAPGACSMRSAITSTRPSSCTLRVMASRGSAKTSVDTCESLCPKGGEETDPLVSTGAIKSVDTCGSL